MRYVVDSATVEGVKKIPTRGFSMGQNVTAVGSQIPEHAHESSEEGMYIVSGQGRLITEEGKEELRAGMAIYMPPGVKHSILNTGDEELKLIWVYSPPLWVYSPPLPQHRLQNSNT